MAEQIQIETVETDRFSMDYFRFGHGEDTLVILPGLSVQSVMLFAGAVADAYSVLTDDYTIYLFDRRKDLPDDYTVYDMAEDTGEALKVLGLERVSVMGASQGGMIAMVMAAGKPELVQKLVLCSTSACLDDDRYKTFEKWIKLAEDGDAEGLYLSFGEALYPEEMFEQSKGLMVEAAKSVTEEELERFVSLTKCMKGLDITDELRKIECPVFVVGSEDDRVLGPEASLRIAELLGEKTHTELHMYDGYGHAVYDTAPDYKERMLKFLTSAE